MGRLFSQKNCHKLQQKNGIRANTPGCRFRKVAKIHTAGHFFSRNAATLATH
jgi:hypothetical protein